MTDQASVELFSATDEGKTVGTSVSGPGILGGERDVYLHLIDYGVSITLVWGILTSRPGAYRTPC